MIQEISSNHGQITQTGDVIICQGGAVCPLQADAPESKLQAEFAEATGIWCPREAREFFEMLMAIHQFTAKELASAWNDTIIFDRATRSIRTSVSAMEFFAGILGFISVLAILVMYGVWVTFRESPTTSGDYVMLILLSNIYLGGSWLVGRFIMQPRRVALRVRSVFEKMCPS